MKQFASYTLDTANECLWKAGTRIPLAPKPFAVLRYLVENAGRLVSHDELLDALWPEIYVQPQVLRTYMLEIRKVLGDDPRNPRFIRSVPKRGYCFIAAIVEASERASSGEAKKQPAQSRMPRSGFAGRERELAGLAACVREAAAGSRQVAFLTGETGVGKSAILKQFQRELEPTFAVALGQCVRGFAARQEYYPLADALRQLRDCPGAEAAFQTLHTGATGNAALPGIVCAAIEEICPEKPLAILLDDLQWADRSTLDVISGLARRHGNARLMIVACLVPHPGEGRESIDERIHDLRIRGLCTEIAIPRLGKAELAELLHGRLEQPELPDGLHEYVYQHSEGNPRYALTFVEHLIGEGLLRRVGEQWELCGPVSDLDETAPTELARTIELELARLSEREQKVLEAASIPAVAFPAWMVAAALEEDVASAEETCDSLVRRVPFVKRAGEEEMPGGARTAFYVFTHALYREVLYRRQSPARRAARHARIARRLREMFAGREALIAIDAASHYEAAGEWKDAAVMLRIAARRAIEMRAYGEAAELEARIARLGASMPAAGTQGVGISAADGRAWSASDDTDLPYTAPMKA